MADTKRKQVMLKDLEKALVRLQKGRSTVVASDAKINISNVAKEAATTAANIHNNYPDIAEKIRGLLGRGSRAQRDLKNEALKHQKAINRNLRSEIIQLNKQMVALASNNASLTSENSVLRATLESENVVFIGRGYSH